MIKEQEAASGHERKCQIETSAGGHDAGQRQNALITGTPDTTKSRRVLEQL